jgi:TnpA family transposase
MRDWIKEAVLTRFDERSLQSENIKNLEEIKNQLYEMEQSINNIQAEADRQLIHDMLDLYSRMATIQNEWLYTKGIQDGIHLLTYLECEETHTKLLCGNNLSV